MEKYYIVTIDNVVKNNYVEADNFLYNVIPIIKFPILAKGTESIGEYIDLITNELIVDPLLSLTESNLHCIGVTEVEPRYCEYYLSKLNDESINNYVAIMNKIKHYTKVETEIDRQIAEQNQKSEKFIRKFKSKYRKR